MPSYMVTAKEDATPEQVKELKQQIEDQGGKITTEFKLIKGFAVIFDDDVVSTLEKNPLVNTVEVDSEVHTQ